MLKVGKLYEYRNPERRQWVYYVASEYSSSLILCGDLYVCLSIKNDCSDINVLDSQGNVGDTHMYDAGDWKEVEK